MAELNAVQVANIKNGVNNLDVGIYSITNNQLGVKLYSVNSKDLKFYYNSFTIYNDDIRFNIVQDLFKTAFMFPYRLTNDNIYNNQVELLPELTTNTKDIQGRINQVQNQINEIMSENEYYSVYVGEMSEAIQNDQLIRIVVEKDGDCYGHKAYEVSA